MDPGNKLFWIHNADCISICFILFQEMIEPFKEQLESFELEKKALLSQSEQAQGEVKKLAIQYGSLLGKP
jgi:hypothetical protein